jgi:hypothetical protein
VQEVEGSNPFAPTEQKSPTHLGDFCFWSPVSPFGDFAILSPRLSKTTDFESAVLCSVGASLIKEFVNVFLLDILP